MTTTTGRLPRGSRPVASADSPHGARRGAPLRRLVAVLVALVVVALGTASLGPWEADISPVEPPSAQVTTPEPSPEPVVPTPEETPPSREAPADPNALLVGVLIVLGALALIAVARVLARLRGRWRAGDRSPADPTDAADPDTADAASALSVVELRDAVSEALDAIEDARSARDAVIAAWLVLERAAERRGVARDPAQSPSEFTRAVLAATAADAASADTLLRLYLRVRFGTAETTAADVATAQVALRRLTADLRGGAT